MVVAGDPAACRVLTPPPVPNKNNNNRNVPRYLTVLFGGPAAHVRAGSRTSIRPLSQGRLDVHPPAREQAGPASRRVQQKGSFGERAGPKHCDLCCTRGVAVALRRGRKRYRSHLRRQPVVVDANASRVQHKCSFPTRTGPPALSFCGGGTPQKTIGGHPCPPWRGAQAPRQGG